ncbi:SDR family NAD(P)-dependent oxidoreductase, partial [Enterococcus faecium]
MSHATYPSLAQRVVFISGGASGIGAALVDAFVQQGARVAFCDIDMDVASALCARYPEATRPVAYACDVTDIPGYQSVLDQVMDAWGPI